MRKQRYYKVIAERDSIPKGFSLAEEYKDGTRLIKAIDGKEKVDCLTMQTVEAVRKTKTIKDQTDRSGILKISLLPLGLLTSAHKTYAEMKNKILCQTHTSNSMRSQRSLRKPKLLNQLSTFLIRMIQKLRTQWNTKLYHTEGVDSSDRNPSQRISNISVILIVWVLSLATVPHMFIGTGYHDNVYYLLELSLITFLSVCMGLYFISDGKTWVNRVLRFVTFANACWYGIGVVGEIVNFFDPDIVINNFFNDSLWLRIAFVFEIGVIASLFYERKLKRS